MEKISLLLKPEYTIEKCYEYIKIRYIDNTKSMKKNSKFIRDNCPEYANQIIIQAEGYMKGMMILCGTMGKPYCVGNPPKWSKNPLNDNEFVWQLNRMEHWVVLIQAYYLTGDIKYAKKVLEELENWIDTCQPLEIVLDYKTAKERFSSVHPWRSLEVGIRAHKSWNYCFETLSFLPQFNLQLFLKMIESLYSHAEILYTVCPVIWPNANHNHYLTECLGLLEISGMLDFFKDSDKWRVHAQKELERCAYYQVTEQGGQVEGCPSYHHECLHGLTYSLEVANKYNIKFSREYERRIQSMFEYSLYSTRPDGNAVPWGDSDSKPYIYDSAFYMYSATKDIQPLKYCVAIFSKEELIKAFYRQVWKIDEPLELMRIIADNQFGEGTELLPCVSWNKSLKQVMIRTKWKNEAASIFFACRTPVHNDHAHIDPNGFDYYNKGQPILVDAGRYNYQEGPNRKLFKGGGYHNTLLINERDAFEYIGTWEYGEQKQGDILNVGKVKDINYVCASHINYWPVIHTRMVALNEDILIVIDKLDGREKKDIANIYYNLNSTDVLLDANNRMLQASKEGIYISSAYSENLECMLLKGRASTEIDHAIETTILKLNSLNDTNLFLMVFNTGNEASDIKISKVIDGEENANVAFSINNHKYDFIWDYATSKFMKN